MTVTMQLGLTVPRSKPHMQVVSQLSGAIHGDGDARNDAQCGRALTRADLARSERKISQALPEDYGRFLLRYNGGQPELDFAPIIGMPQNPYLRVQQFYGLDQERECCEAASAREWLSDRVGDDAIPVAGFDCGDTFVLYSSRARNGQVGVWDQASAWGKEPGVVTMYTASESSDQFIESLVWLPSSEAFG